jgi:hypothetical protein
MPCNNNQQISASAVRPSITTSPQQQLAKSGMISQQSHTKTFGWHNQAKASTDQAWDAPQAMKAGQQEPHHQRTRACQFNALLPIRPAGDIQAAWAQHPSLAEPAA